MEENSGDALSSDGEELSVIVVNQHDKKGTMADALKSAYGKECNFAEMEFTNSLRKAIQSYKSGHFKICFISSEFETVELEEFFRDYKILRKVEKSCFLQVKKEIQKQEEYKQSEELGFDGLVTLKGSQADRDQLEKALEKISENEVIAEKKLDVRGALNVVLRKIDDAARNRKRGKFEKIDNLPAEFIEVQTDYNDEILADYFEQLEEKLQEAEPENADKLHVPDVILERDLPGLIRDQYNGVSNRVWRKMLRKHGIEDDSKNGAVNISQTPSETKPPESQAPATEATGEQTTTAENTPLESKEAESKAKDATETEVKEISSQEAKPQESSPQEVSSPTQDATTDSNTPSS